ncbi:transcription factor grauzone-like [Anopheles cruzii]|uniref:transcription factor grauzone-like n=1 Tax=Anopheles cruzii TaxID=68878 RepID=UPI0022EC23B1|nr:transcription factor grauzone-like [Anopheles cruzii]
MEQFVDKCRLCLDVVGGPMVERVENLPEVFLFSIALTTDDPSWPVNVCRRCFSLVDNFYKFSNIVHQNQERLRTVAEAGTVPEATVKLQQLVVEVKLESPPEQESELGEESVTIKVEEHDGPGMEEILTEEVVQNDDADSSASEEACSLDDRQPESGEEESATSIRSTGNWQKHRKKVERDRKGMEQENKLIAEYFRFSCELCHQTAENFILLKRHYRTEHDRAGFVRCCERKLFKRCNLLEHVKVHLNPSLFSCEVCGKSYRSKEYLQRHQQESHDPTLERKYKCTECSHSFLRKHLLTAHLARHVKVQCTECDRVLSSKAALGIHMLKIHGNTGGQICDICGREFRTKTSFDKHIRKHNAAYVPERFPCKFCDKKLMSKVGLKKHVLAKHTTFDEEFICTECGSRYPHKLALDNHKRKVHIEEKYECEFCGRRFKNTVSLREHRAIHTGEELYSCEYCSATFKSKSNMYAHKKKVHHKEWAAAKMQKALAT